MDFTFKTFSLPKKMLNVLKILDCVTHYRDLQYHEILSSHSKKGNEVFFISSLLCLVVSGKRRHCVPAIRANRQVHAGPLKSTADSLSMRQERSTQGQVKEQSGMLG